MRHFDGGQHPARQIRLVMGVPRCRKWVVDARETKREEIHAGIDKQNEAISKPVAQRNHFVQKYNDEVKDRNAIMEKKPSWQTRYESSKKVPDNKRFQYSFKFRSL